MGKGEITVRGARTRNLRNVYVRLPHGAMTVVSGVSGSGKSSLAFDTIFAEGRRRYLESLPSSARQYLEKLPRPDVDVVEGLAPAISIAQPHGGADPRSTLATLADLHGHFRLVFAHFGTAHCPECGRAIRPVSAGALAAKLLREPSGTRMEILSPAWVRSRRRRREETAAAAVAAAAREGFVRIVADGSHFAVEEADAEAVAGARRIDVVIDRIVAKDGIRTRLADSVELAMKRSGGEVRIFLRRPGETANTVLDESDRLLCPGCDLVFERLEPSSFSFNSPHGACPDCGGLGVDSDGAQCRSCGGTRPAAAPRACRVEFGSAPHLSLPEALALDVGAASAWVAALRGALPAPLEKAAAPVFDGLSARLRFLEETGLGYLTLDRAADTLSGGEARRVRLASALSQDLSGALYVLDEPTAGLHPRDTAALLAMLGRLRDSGNTLVVVEHDENVVRAADWVIDMGPGAGARGGRVVYSGSVAGMMQCADSPTGLFLAGKEPPYRPGPKAPGRDGFLEVRGARAHNLKGATAHFPIGCMTGVSGVSGSGKSSLVADVLGANLSELASRRRAGDGRRGPWIDCDAIGGFEKIRRVVQVGRCVRAGGSRSVVATACGAFDRIRALFASTELARTRGYGAGRFSFHAKGGRCEACRGEGERTLEMAFLPDSAAVCEECGGRRYNRETLDVHWAGLSIADVLDADVAEAGRVFRAIPALSRLFSSLESFGLGYLTLGQRVSTLSGGEAQRLLLAAELATGVCSGTLYILDEPASGQHPRDVNALVKVLESLRSSGGTIVAVEHRPQVLRAMDWIVELGPGAGPRGGEVVAEGVPAAVAEAVGG